VGRNQGRGARSRGFGYDPHFYLPELGRTRPSSIPSTRTGSRTAARRCASWSKNCAAFPNLASTSMSTAGIALASGPGSAGLKALPPLSLYVHIPGA